MFLSGCNIQAHMCRIQISYFIVVCPFYRNFPRLVVFTWERLNKAQWHSGWNEGIGPCLSGLPKDSTLISPLWSAPDWDGCSPTVFHSGTSPKALFLPQQFVGSPLLSLINQVNLLPDQLQDSTWN